MALQSSGQISLGDVNVELGNARTNQLAIGSSAARSLANVLAGTIKMSDFYGKSSLTVTFVPAPGTGGVLSIDESANTTVTFNTVGAPNGTVLYWEIENTTTSGADWTATSGSFTINSNTGSFTLRGVADTTTEGDETFILRIRAGSATGGVVCSVNGTLVDSSVTPGATPVVPTYTNPGFEGTITPPPPGGTTYYIEGWTIETTLVFPGSPGGYSPNTIASWPVPSDNTMPSPYVYPIWPNPGSGYAGYDYNLYTELSSDVPSGSNAGTQSVRLWAQGWVPQGYGILYGPYMYSTSAANLAVGDQAKFWWRAAGGADAYNVFAYLLEINTGATIQLLNGTGANLSAATPWAEVSVTVNTAGQYRFVFLSGTWDQTGGQYLGASLYVTRVSIFKP